MSPSLNRNWKSLVSRRTRSTRSSDRNRLLVLHLDLHIGAALAGLGVLDLDGAPQAALELDDVARTNVHAADLH
jgi:hypothetical protein